MKQSGISDGKREKIIFPGALYNKKIYNRKETVYRIRIKFYQESWVTKTIP